MGAHKISLPYEWEVWKSQAEYNLKYMGRQSSSNGENFSYFVAYFVFLDLMYR